MNRQESLWCPLVILAGLLLPLMASPAAAQAQIEDHQKQKPVKAGIKVAVGTASIPEHNKVKDLVCGMEVDPDSSTTLKVDRSGKAYYFCSAMCRNKFLANPDKYITKETAGEPKMAKDLVCGMDVDPKAAGTLKFEYKGKTYYFCSEMCRKNFQANPEQYMKQGMAPDHQHRMRMQL